jgi:hypothetical protein
MGYDLGQKKDQSKVKSRAVQRAASSALKKVSCWVQKKAPVRV